MVTRSRASASARNPPARRGHGKVSFNPFSITRKIDRSSPVFFQMALDQFVGVPVVVHDGGEL